MTDSDFTTPADIGLDTLPQPAQDAPGGDGDSDPIADTLPDQADALDTRQRLYPGGARHES